MWRTFFSWFVKITGFLPWLIVTRPKVYYKDKKTQSKRIKGKGIIISNHTDVFDFAMMMFTFWRRNPRCVVAELMFEKNGFMNWFLKSLGCIRVDRNGNDFGFIQKCVDALDKGHVVEIYPEARIPEKDELKPLEFKPSTAYIALQSGAPIIPVYTTGGYFKKGRSTMIIGTPIDVREMFDESVSEQENIKNITELLRKEIVELGNELEKRKEKAKV